MSFEQTFTGTDSSSPLFVINCAASSTLQDLKIPDSSGVFTYQDDEQLNSTTTNRYLVWRTCEDVLELTEQSLNRDLHNNELRVQFKNSLILPSSVSVQETSDKIFVLVVTLVSAHRLCFPHPNRLSSASLGASLSATSSTDLPRISILHPQWISLEELDSPIHSVPLPTSTPSTIGLGPPSSLPYLATASWVSADTCEAFFVLSNPNATLHLVRLPPPDSRDPGEVKLQNFDLKQSNLIGKLFQGFVPSIMKSTSGAEAAISLLTYNTAEDDLIFALCRDCKLRVISLHRQGCIITQNLFYQPPPELASPGKPASNGRPVSMKFWWYDNDETGQPLPNLVVHVSGPPDRQKTFHFYEVSIPTSMNGSFRVPQGTVQSEPQLRLAFEKLVPPECDVLDYFVSDGQLWALWQQNDAVHLQYFSIDVSTDPNQPLEWIPVLADLAAPPDMSLRSTLVNSREYYLSEIFWKGHFSLTTIARAITVFGRLADASRLRDAKIDVLITEAIKVVDNNIRNNQADNLELTAEEYTKLEMDSWHHLYLFCLEYNATESRPMSIFVDLQTGVKGLVRRSRLEFIPHLAPIDELINHYFLYCRQQKTETAELNGDVVHGASFARVDSMSNLFSYSALQYRLHMLMVPIEKKISGVFSATLERSILALLHGMGYIYANLQDSDLLNFEALMHRISSCSSKGKLSLADIAREITEDSLLPERSSLNDASSHVSLIEDFFDKCPLVAEAISFLLQHITFDFASNSTDIVEQLGLSFEVELQRCNGDEREVKMEGALQHEILPNLSQLLSSRYGLDFAVASITKSVQSRYRFCRDLFLFQYMLSKFRHNLKSENMPKIVPIEAVMIPQTAQTLFSLDFLTWVCETPMITANLWWNYSDSDPQCLTKVTAVSTSPGSQACTALKSSAMENTKLLSVLELREYIKLNRVGLLSHETTFYDAYPRATILYFYVQFSGGIQARRLLSYHLSASVGGEERELLHPGSIWPLVLPSYLTSICQLLWPSSVGQFKLAEFLLGVAQYDLLERCIQRLHTWCFMCCYSRYFLKGICLLVTGQGHKAIKQFKSALFGIGEPFLHRIFNQKAKNYRAPLETQIEPVPDESMGGDPTAEPSRSSRRSSRRSATLEECSVLPNARTIFRYYQKLIQLFKHYSSPDHVIELVQIALSTLDSRTDPEFEEHHSSLHSTLFDCHLRLNNVEQAYNAMIDNLDLEQKKICLRQFIFNLCQTGQLQALVSFPYLGLEDEFVAILEAKARASSVAIPEPSESLSKFSKFSIKSEPEVAPAQLNYYHILYTYFIRVSNFRRAAQSMYDYYRRLAQDTAGCASETWLQRQANALLVARNCLKLVDPTYAWIIKSTVKKIDEEETSLKRKLGGRNHQNKTMIDIADDEELLCEYELVSARLRLLKRNPRQYGIASTTLTPDETLTLCTGASMFPQAFRVAALFKLPLEPIFDGLASKYVQLVNGALSQPMLDPCAGEKWCNEMAALDLEDHLALELADLFGDVSTGLATGFLHNTSLSLADRMWQLIMHFLRLYETQPSIRSTLLKTVAEKLLANGIMIPCSLVKWYQKVNCPELIRLLMTYNFLSEVTHLCIEYMNAFMGHGSEYFDLTYPLYPQCPPLYIPLHLFGCLEKILAEEREASKQDGDWPGARVKLATDSETADGDDDADVDYPLPVEKVDYDQLHKSLTATLAKLRQNITACSR